MSISYETNGSIVLQSDTDPARTKALPSDLPRAQQDAAIVAFFALDVGEDPPPEIAIS